MSARNSADRARTHGDSVTSDAGWWSAVGSRWSTPTPPADGATPPGSSTRTNAARASPAGTAMLGNGSAGAAPGCGPPSDMAG